MRCEGDGPHRMSTAELLQIILLLGVLAPLVSFVLLAFCGRQLPSAERLSHLPLLHWLHRGHAAARARRQRPDAAAHTGGHAGAAAHAPGEPQAGWVATLAIVFSLGMALLALLIWAGKDADTQRALLRQSAEGLFTWLEVGGLRVAIGARLDSLTIIMFLMVTLCAGCIHVFSIGYMKGDSRFSRFFAYLSLFCFSMLGLVVSNNLLLIFAFWELVGICSYLLIGFWFEKKSASDAAIKAFVVNRVGDFGFLIGLGLCVAFLGALSYDGAAAAFEAGAQQAGVLSAPLSTDAQRVSPQQATRAAWLFEHGLFGMSAATLLGLALFCGAIGKSAQFPLHVWLPDAMEGPTPVSALIHAATMVAAGVYMVARIFPLLTPDALFAIAVIGCVTLTMAALLAVVQTDIKRVLAYSTLSQLGYMIFGLGVGAWIGALFHLLTHAFFKALLFLGAGQVIAGCHHEQDMRRMGGLRRKMPQTATTFLIAVLAISGAGLPWLGVGIGGYYSKDEILAVAWYRGAGGGGADAEHAAAPGGASALILHAAAEPASDAPSPHSPAPTGARPLPWLLVLLPIVVAYVTPFYMGRCYVLTFLGRPRDAGVHQHAHESPIMVWPLMVLAALTLVSGIGLFRLYVSAAAPVHAPLGAPIDGESHALHATHLILPLVVGFAFVVGLGAAWWLYRDGLARAESLRQWRIGGVAPLAALHAALQRRLYFDDVHNALLVGGTRLLARVSRLFDNGVIDGVVNLAARLAERVARFSGVVLDALGVDGAVNLLAAFLRRCGDLLRAAQTGRARHYVLLAAALLAAGLLSRWSPTAAAWIGILCVLLVVARLPGGSREPAREGRP